MLLVVLGAGASYDSVSTFPPSSYGHPEARLPLANELFDFRNRREFAADVAEYPQCRPVLPYLENSEGGISVERVLQQLQDEATGYPERHKHLAAIRFYLVQMIWKCETRWDQHNVSKATNQITLLDQIEHWSRPSAYPQVFLVTFNYDLMLEKALRTVGVNIRNLADYITASDAYKLIKLHGSVNWARVVDNSVALSAGMFPPYSVINTVIDSTAELNISKQYQFINLSEFPIDRLGQNAAAPLFPAIAIPIEIKSDYECPDYHLEALLAFLPKVDRILIIGWRGAEKHFLQTVAANLQQDVQGFVVSGSSNEATETIERIKEAGIKGEYKAFGEGFSNFIVSRAAEPLLNT